MSTLASEGRLERALRRAIAATTRTDHAAASAAGVTFSTCYAQVLDLLVLHGPLSPGQLAQLTGITSSGTITGSIDALERAGYVRRVRCVVDRRKVAVELNEDKVASLGAARTSRLAALTEGYTEGERAAIADFLERLAESELPS
ncbi:MarR family winged helix-turn-helix transcriptional regulator [Tenggerimyces flavus]|uniref:MarR family winged helix-turn-helix transcriptional regulator n=1 Tax=Tenggerimyces flavus TaxID=1708749 RepID=A0ABV7YAZ2_9ACTN|nr:MarR family transcriptional regulator [Tenggerimyces flavus]MBM7786593.1 DNA-binding MarR family transcriptional regulator [Tenggerimyces flavus]